jgi:hypothetical protein
MSTIYLVKNDTASQVEVKLTREDTGQVMDLTDATVELHFRKKHTTTKLWTKQAVITDASNGVAVFTFDGNKLDQDPGQYEGEVEVTFAGGGVETVFDLISFSIRDEVD